MAEEDTQTARATSAGDAKLERDATGDHMVGAQRDPANYSAPPATPGIDE